MEKHKKLSDYSDRELLERIAANSKKAADDAGFVKSVVILSIILSIISLVLNLS